jgi:hypothetical protein
MIALLLLLLLYERMTTRRRPGYTFAAGQALHFET